VLEPIAHLDSQTEAHREQPRDHAVRRLHRDQRTASRDQQRSETYHATRDRLAATDVAEDEARVDGVGEVAVRPQLDVVAEPGGLLVRVRVATQPREQRHVVDDRALGLAELEVLRDAEAEHARSQHMLHRLSEAEIRGQRHRSHQLSEPHLRSGERGHD
jgi:hypothetical protein